MSSKSHVFVGLAVSGLGAMAVCPAALASGFAVRENGPDNIAMAYAGVGSRADDPSTAFANPAAMTDLPGTQTVFGASFVYPTIKFHGNATSGGTPISGVEGNSAGRPAGIPNFYTVFDITDRLKGGIAVTVPFGNTVKYKYNFYGRYAPGGLDTAALSMNINPSLAFKVNDSLSIGAGVSAQWFQVTFANAVNQAALLATPGTPDATARFQGDDWGFGYNLGIYAKPWDGGQLGLTYRSMVRHQASGDLKFTAVNPFLTGTLANQKATADVNLPASADFSLTETFGNDISISWDVEWTGWSTFHSSNLQGSAGLAIPVTQGYEDSWMTSIGIVYRANRAWTWRGGLGWDQSPVKDAYRTVGVPDADRTMVAFGFDYNFSDTQTFQAAYTHYFAPHATMNSSVNGTDMFGSVTMHGNYSLGMDFIAGSMRYKY